MKSQNYPKFSFKALDGIYLIRLPEYRSVVRDWGHGRREYKRVSSYVIFNAQNKTSKIINYEEARASVYDNNLNAYLVDEEKPFLVAENGQCYYMDKDGAISSYDGDIISMRKTKVTIIHPVERMKPQITSRYNWEEFESGVCDKTYTVGSNSLTLPNGTIAELPYKIKKDFGELLLCYKEIPSNKGDWNEEMYGICDREGKIIIEPKYSSVYTGGFKDENFFEVVKDNKHGVINAKGVEIIPPLYSDISDCDGNVAVVDDNRKLIRVNDLKVLYETGERLEWIVDGYIRVVTRSYPTMPLGILDSNGVFFKITIKNPIGYGNLYEEIGQAFYDGLLPVFTPSRGYGFVNKDSKEVVKCNYNEIHNYVNGRALVRYDTDFRYIDKIGNIFVKDGEEEVLIPNKYDWAYDFDNGIAIVQQKEKYGSIDKNINEIFPCVFLSIEQLKKAYARVFINTGSKDYRESVLELEYPIPYKENNLFGYKRIDGKILCPPIFTDAHKFVEGLSLVRYNGKVGFLNKNLEFEVLPEYGVAEDFSEGLSLVNNRYYINKNGETIIHPDHHIERLTSFQGGKVSCEYNWCQPRRENDDYILTKRIRGFN